MKSGAIDSKNKNLEKAKAPTPRKQHQGSHLEEWAWEDSNLRPHAYQALPLPCPGRKLRKNRGETQAARATCRGDRHPIPQPAGAS